jgi:hypothetical protein
VIIKANLDNQFISEHKRDECSMLLFAKLAYVMRLQLKDVDTVIDNLTDSIMENAGMEMNYSAALISSTKPST